MPIFFVREGTEAILDLPNLHGNGVPREGDYMVVEGKQYKATSVLWHYDERVVYIAGKEVEE